MSTEQEQKRETPVSTYLDALPSVYPEPEPEPSAALSAVETREAQSKLLLRKLADLSEEEPAVTINLDSALDSQLHTELVDKGYYVGTAYMYTCVNGKERKYHVVTVSRPSTDLVDLDDLLSDIEYRRGQRGQRDLRDWYGRYGRYRGYGRYGYPIW